MQNICQSFKLYGIGFAAAQILNRCWRDLSFFASSWTEIFSSSIFSIINSEIRKSLYPFSNTTVAQCQEKNHRPCIFSRRAIQFPHAATKSRAKNIRRRPLDSQGKGGLVFAGGSFAWKLQLAPLCGKRAAQKSKQLCHALPPRRKRKGLLFRQLRLWRKRRAAAKARGRRRDIHKRPC